MTEFCPGIMEYVLKVKVRESSLHFWISVDISLDSSLRKTSKNTKRVFEIEMKQVWIM